MKTGNLIAGLFFLTVLLSCGSGPDRVSSLSTSEITYTVLQANVLGPKCLYCHNESAPQSGVSFSSYDALMTSPGAVVPYTPSQSQTYKQSYKGNMPKDAKALTSAELQQIYDWISLGAKNN